VADEVLLSLVSAPVLGFDLTRHRHGDAIAAVLLRALACGPDDLPVFGAAHLRFDPSALAAAWQDVRAAGEATLVHDDPAVRPLGDDRSPAELAEELALRMICDLDAIEALVRSDVFAWCASALEELDPNIAHAAAGAFVGAIASVWGHHDVPTSSRRLLVGAFLHGCRMTGSGEADLGPNGEAVRAELARLASIDQVDRDRMRAVVGVQRRALPSEWPTAMNEASWAALTTGRIRAAATAQLLAVRAYATSGFDAKDSAEGVWNAISGYVQSQVMPDVLSGQVVETLERTWRTVFGPFDSGDARQAARGR
jgi:hypothetical protein